jgi:hypothetical protein
MAKYDDASWHHGGDFPASLPRSAAATHIGMFLAWCVLAGHAGEELREESGSELERLRERAVTPGAFLIALDEKLVDSQLDAVGNAFAVAYYSGRDDESLYMDDYVDLFDDDAEEIYGVPDTWANFDRLAAVVQRRFDGWQAAGSPRYI